MLVVFYHAGRLISLPQYYDYIPLGNVFGFGHAGVDFFFVLSGFIITHVHRRDLGRPAALGRFCARRFVRIYPLYWVVSAIVIGLALFSPDWATRLQPSYIIASLLLLPHGQDPLLGVGWTLEHEMLFYLAFAAAIASRRLGFVLMAAGAAAAMAPARRSGNDMACGDPVAAGMAAPARLTRHCIRGPTIFSTPVRATRYPQASRSGADMSTFSCRPRRLLLWLLPVTFLARPGSVVFP